MASEADPFRGFHRHALWMTLARRFTALCAGAAVVTALSLAAAAAPPPSATASPGVAPQPAAAAITTLDALPAPAADAAAAPEAAASSPLVEPVLALTGSSANWSIDIDTVGYQAEVDACLWVRMDLHAAAPLVGAHNFCGGDIVLRMAVGETVTLTGTSLDGVYTVVEARDAEAGQNAAEATSGMVADAILQTCYWHSNGRERLLALQRI